MDSIQAYVGKQHSMLPVGIRSCDIPYSHRDGNVRVPTSEFVCLFLCIMSMQPPNVGHYIFACKHSCDATEIRLNSHRVLEQWSL